MKPELLRRPDFWACVGLSLGVVFAAWRGWTPFGLTEAIGFATGAVCVYLTVWENVWNFPVGIVNNVAFFLLFFHQRIFGDAWLQVVYLALALHGWHSWLYAGPDRTELRVGRATPWMFLALGAFVPLGTWGLVLALRHFGGSAPVPDAFTTVLSLAAQYLLNRKCIENWFVWITADVIYIHLYISRGLYLTATLYLVLMGLCVAGLLRWRGTLRRQPPAEFAPPAHA